MDLLVLFGPPAAGKMTVGRAICARTRYRLFHNHMTIEPLLGLFPFGSPPYARLTRSFREQILEECLQQGEFDLVFTYVWGLDLESDTAFVKRLADRVAAAGGTTRYAELACDLDERLARNRTAERLDHKRSKRDVAASEAGLLEWEGTVRMQSAPGELDGVLAPYVRVDNTALPADGAADAIIRSLGLPTV
ncbi:MAG: hypothetical protein H6737_30250 [Alphaproteobacteria bacterium]|nr:hypothetical protein [Alphaproteobacteria bacterium]